ncbi:hypothetical protein C0991_005820 [Blastosporella zonata]|nr:hypothetical protein C0991_005820 [Blastosporella zonata]
MAKTKTPQELYRAKKQREEQEKAALLPPGLYNHGNTCFMNSVLQGLIATRLLFDLAHFRPTPPLIQQHYNLSSRKSPLLTNGHDLSGQYEQEWVDMMPIGDVFLDLMVKAWDSQSRQKRESLSPKRARAILAALGRKYDQYLDFAQQDAHEFLRILLDASRMEELDVERSIDLYEILLTALQVIKKRQPPTEKKRKRRQTTITPSRISSQSSALPPTIPEEEKLATLSDMIFGGKFASILVCRECKNVSQTYEDFNDISLSIKAEDYQSRKRDRLKNLAKRLTSFPTQSLGISNEVPRPSSVPPSPREGEYQLAGHEEPHSVPDPRRRSFDVVPDAVEPDSDTSASASKEDSVAPQGIAPDSATGSRGKHIEFSSSAKPEKKDKSDGWAKLGRRISMSVTGMGNMGKGKSRTHDKPTTKERSVSLEVPRMESSDSGASARSDLSEAISIPLVASPQPLANNGHDALLHSRVPSPRPVTPPAPHTQHHRKDRASHPPRPKSPKPPKPTPGELNYLREILADVTPASFSNPLTFLKPLHHGQSNRSVSTPSPNLWLSMNHFSGIEECLRMFTSVEIMDGENMVGCRRCWKIANGEYEKPSPEDEGNGNEDSDEGEEVAVEVVPPPVAKSLTRLSKSDLSPLRPAALTHIPTSMSTPTVSLYTHTNNSDPRSVSSLPTTAASSIHESDLDAMATVKLIIPNGLSRPSTPGGLPIPFISTTGPDSPIGPRAPMERSNSLSLDKPTPIAQPLPRIVQVLDHLLPSTQHHHTLSIPRHLRRPDPNDDESSGGESDASATSIRSTESSTSTSARRTTKKPKPVIMRAAYKRYLIGTPPPVLVIHLKRFQQINKTNILSFSHGFKKLDDFVTFPEFLDLTPYLAPRKEDFGLGKKGKAHHDHHRHGLGLGLGKRSRKEEKCMYRLYAVVVHIGNMLGGHYIAYTALPDTRPSLDTASEDSNATTTELKAPRQWAYISDTIVRLTTLDEVLKAKAYMCMYERI